MTDPNFLNIDFNYTKGDKYMDTWNSYNDTVKKMVCSKVEQISLILNSILFNLLNLIEEKINKSTNQKEIEFLSRRLKFLRDLEIIYRNLLPPSHTTSILNKQKIDYGLTSIEKLISMYPYEPLFWMLRAILQNDKRIIVGVLTLFDRMSNKLSNIRNLIIDFDVFKNEVEKILIEYNYNHVEAKLFGEAIVPLFAYQISQGATHRNNH